MIKKVILYFTNLWYSIIRVGSFRGSENMLSFLSKNKDKDITVFDIAKFFSSKQVMSHKKLQKLVYYAYAWYIALYNESVDDINTRLCVDTQFEAWVHGPVCRKLYNICSDHYGTVPKYDGELHHLITGELKSYLENIYDTFGKYTGDELESMTHLEMPWQNARDNLLPSVPSKKIISEADMFIYYNSL